ncbi:MAG: HAD family hydrolase [Candidatus Bathyarchaeota archaeon]|nr:HAD family hydrolase [Candidatus Bathyarchaeota archaeon]
MIRGVLFDFDGVLVPIDTELKRKLREEIIEEYCTQSLSTREQAKAHLDQALSESTYDDPYLKLQDAALQLGSFRRDEINQLFHQISQKREIELENTIVDMLRHLKECGLVVGIVTLSSKERIGRVLRNIGVRDFFDFVESASREFLEAPRSEWKKAAYQSFLDDHKFQASEVLCVGDTPSIDLRPAKSLGMQTVLVIHNDNRELEKKGLADRVLRRDTLCETLPSLVLDTDD